MYIYDQYLMREKIEREKNRQSIPLSVQIDSLPQGPWQLSFHDTLYFNIISGPRTSAFPLALLPSCFLRQNTMALASLWGTAAQEKKMLWKEVFKEHSRLREWKRAPCASFPIFSWLLILTRMPKCLSWRCRLISGSSQCSLLKHW